MTETRIKINSIIQNQLPEFVKEEFPLVSEFLKQYYISLETQGSPFDLVQNIDKYVKVDNLSNLISSTTLTSDVSFYGDTISVVSTVGFPESYGLLLIDSEVITYTSKTSTTFEGCVRGFSGITSYKNSDELTFTESESQEHSALDANGDPTEVLNLSILFLQEFFIKLKTQITPGFENRELYSELNDGLFIKQANDFYSSKGTERSFDILFRSLYGKDVKVIRPSEYLIQPSDAYYKRTADLVVVPIEGDLDELINQTIYQDSNTFLPKSTGTVTQVEKIQRGDKEYYVLSLDYEEYQKNIKFDGRSLFGPFSIHPKTLSITEIFDTNPEVGVFNPSSSVIDVDSTVGFPQSGNLLIDLENGSQVTVSYADKTLTQFLNCFGITQPIPSGTEIKTDAYAYGHGNSQQIIKFRVTGVLSDLIIKEKNSRFSVGDPIKIKTLGDKILDYKFNNWFFNVATSYETKSIQILDSSNNSYAVDFYDDHSFVVGDRISIVSLSGGESDERVATVVAFRNKKSITIVGAGILNHNQTYNIRKILSRLDSINYPNLSQYTTNVQNVYIDDEKSLYVTSPSLPTYLNQKIKVNDRSVLFSGSFSGSTLNIGNHPFYTGDSVYYRSVGTNNNLGISDGFYFVEKVSSTSIRLSKSRANLYSKQFVSVNGSVVDNKLEFSSFVSENSLQTKQLEPQKLVRKLSNPINNEINPETLPGSTGILVNGVEILNYKSTNRIFYGPIESISVTSSGSGYDVINPPILQITDDVGFGATAYCNVKGALERIDVIEPGFDYLENPKIKISGGNGFGARAEANLIIFTHNTEFNASQASGSVDSSNLTISSINDHKFRDYESIVYDPQGQTVVGGLSTNSVYFVSVIDSKKIKLHSTFEDSISGINTISITNTGNGIQRFRSTSKKKKIGSITVTNSGSNYENKKRVTNPSGINTSLNLVNIQNHGFQSGEVVKYNFTETSIVGLASTSSYYVTKIDDDNFKLSIVSTSSTQTQDINYKTKTYVDLTSNGSGIHIFNYEPITVTVSGIVGISTLAGQDFNAVLQPVFRGNIESVNLQSGGNSFGSAEIINFNKQPLFELSSGSDAQITPIINNGSIVDVLINNQGANYNSPPNLIINGSGSGAILVPIISGGYLTSIKVISGGIGYSNSNTTIDVISAGSEAKFESRIKSWNINLFERYLQTNQITDDDGILENSFSGFGLEYCHLYAPRKLRSSVLSTRYKNGEVFYDTDLVISNGKEVDSLGHSPLLGWAYDGNPIYGPYGYSSPNGGSIRFMVSGYQLKLKENRPSTSSYPAGFFVDDYEFIGNGDLDEHNGRFCITPEYPNGVYAYFATIDSSSTSSGPFKNYKLPVFPYFIGNTYKSNIIEYNFLKTSNQTQIDINQTEWVRNTTPYNLINSKSGYSFLYDPNKVREQISSVKSVSRGTINSIGIVTGGKDYKVNDSIVFDTSDLLSKNPKSSVSFVKGKEVTSVSVATSELSFVEFYPTNKSDYIAISSSPHYFNNRDIVTVSSDFEFEKTSQISVRSNNLFSASGIGSTSYTGIVTYFNVFGNIDESVIKENDIYQIGNEIVKILNVDYTNSRIRVLRNITKISGITTYSAGIALTEVPRKLNLNFKVDGEYNNRKNKELYFNPTESLGIGTTSGPGISTTLVFSNPGAGATQISVPTRSIYFPNHELQSGDELIYSSNEGTRISISTDGISSYQLPESSVVYATRLNADLIGISSYRVGLGTTGYYVGLTTTSDLFYFTNVGSGEIHSFKTNHQNILTGKISKSEVTVSTAATHGLLLEDNVVMNVISGFSTTISVSYDDYNRRTVINRLNFLSSDVNVSRDTITINNHGLYTSQKVIHISSSPSAGLVNEEIYYVIVVDDNTIKLSNSYYYSSRKERNLVGITSASFGSILPVNPPVKLTNKNTLVFDVSSPTLSFTNNGVLYSAFDLEFYTDSNFKNKLNFTNPSNVEVVRSGKIGIDANATVSLRLNDSTPRKIYYRLVPTNLNIIPQVKNEIIVDDEVINNNLIEIIHSDYSGEYVISGVTTNTFKYNLRRKPERGSYNNTNSTISYATNSLTSYGEIDAVKVSFVGSKLSSIPKINEVSSNLGYGEILEVNSTSIGNVLKTNIDDIGFEYPSDYSLRPTAKLPDLIKIKTQASFKSIGISSLGKNYLTPPSLVVIDGFTNNIVTDVELKYNLNSQYVDILTNTTSMSNTIPTIIPTNNSNGVGISSIRFISSSKDVIVTLGSSFSNASDFPFQIGDKVLIENISVGIGSTAKGFNSSNYNYTLFTIKNTDPNIGGIGATVSYNLTDYLSNGEVPGTFDPVNSAGRIIPQKYFPIFDVSLQKNNFNIGETVVSGEMSGVVVGWDSDDEILKVSSIETFSEGVEIIGKTTNTKGIPTKITSSNVNYIVGSSSNVDKGWQKETGFLNNQFQRVHDSDYYQYFSYSLKSEIPLDTWDNAVGNLNHTSGFKRFSDLVIETSPIVSGINTDQNLGDFVGIADLSRSIDLNCKYDFDLVTENNLTIDGDIKSNQIIFGSRVLQDYIESIGNRVLLIDDLSGQFNSSPRPTKFSIVDTIPLTIRSSKYFTYVQDKLFSEQKQSSLLTIIHDGVFAYLNQYSNIETSYDMGSFDFAISGSEGNLLFYPKKFSVNDYNISLVSFDIKDSVASIGSTSLGDTVFVGSSTTSIANGSSSQVTVVGIASTYRSSKVLVQIGATDSSYYEFNELMVIHDGNNVALQEYGQLNTGIVDSISSLGIGTYYAYYSGSNINIDLIPYTSATSQYNVNSIRVSIGNSLSVGVGTISIFNNSSLSSSYVSIASSATPGITTISTYGPNYNSSYYVVSVEDLTNRKYQVSEVVVINDSSDVYISEFGILQTNGSIGLIGATFSVTGKVDLTFTPNPNIETQVRVYQNTIGVANVPSPIRSIDFTNASIESAYGYYEGTETGVKRTFNLTNTQRPIFERYFFGNDLTVVDTTNNTIFIPEHFFVTGEKLNYYSESNSQIGIATTSIAGIGLTDKLPSTVYVVKEDDLKIKVAASASEALLPIPNVLDITSVGVGTLHRFVSTNQNARVLISIDNLIQSPIVSTSVTAKTAKPVFLGESVITLSGITSFFGGDLIKINDEIMRINAVGFGSTNSILVQRSWMGTGLSTHASDSTVRKITGNYNIVDNLITFAAAPYGLIPFSTSTNAPDSRDFRGTETTSKFGGRCFIKSGIENGLKDAYSSNYIFDDISNGFNGITTTFTLTSNQSNVSGFSTDNAVILINDIFQGPVRVGAVEVQGDYDLLERNGITSISFTGETLPKNYDVNVSNIPKGGIIVSFGSTEGFAYQPLVSAGGTAIVSSSGTISSVSIGNSGSGYRSGIQTVNVGVATSSTGSYDITYIGVATVTGGYVTGVAITNPGIGYTTSNPPFVVFDDPLSYSNIPLIYSSSSSGVGTGAVADIIVGQGSSVISFELKNSGYGYRLREILTVSIGGTTGIPTNTSLPFKEFQISVDRTASDEFTGVSIGELQVIDPLDSLFDGKRVSFPIKINGEQTTIRSRNGSNIEVKANLLVFVNDILQEPDESYIFNGGSIIVFTEAPKEGDTSKIIFYKGTRGVDTSLVDILETVKPGDNLRIDSDIERLQQDSRLVMEVVSTDIVETNAYSGPGISQDFNLLRPVVWCKQTEDKIINGQEVAKDRILYEPLIYPSTNIIQNVSIASTEIFVESVKTFFDSADEYLQDGTSEEPQRKIIIISQDQLVAAAATSIVSTAGTISSIVISDGGVGYSTNPVVVIENPVGLGTTQRATATSTISVAGTVTSIAVSSPGTGYTTTTPPVVLISPPEVRKEVIENVSYQGDFGIISGINTISVGVASTGIVFDFFIPKDSFLRDVNINKVGIATTGVSGIQTGYYFVVYNSNVGNGLTSIYQNGSTLGIGSTFIDNVYQVAAVSIAQTHAIGVGLTYVARVTVSVSNYNGLTGLGYSSFFGQYSWGRIHNLSRSNPNQFTSYNNGLVGILTSPTIQRYNPLKYRNYVS